jgi:hypothetical protein
MRRSRQVVDELPPLLARRSPGKGRSPKKADINVNKPPPKAKEPVVVPWANEGQVSEPYYSPHHTTTSHHHP